MRVFIVSCLLGLAVAVPQGYTYQAQQQAQAQLSQAGSGLLQLPAIPQFATVAEQNILQQALQTPRVQQVLSGGYTSAPQQIQAPPYQQKQQQQQQLNGNFAYNLLPQQHQYQQQQQQQQQHLVSKDIYVHVPPAEDPEEHYPQPVLPVAPPRKHYRIVFIKAPTPTVSKTALRIAPVEEKTIIYVLTKKPDPLELQTALEDVAPKPPNKPEVFFIKYKTQEEAAHAQRTIQAQYDQLGGTSQVSDEGVAPVTSVIGVLDSQRASGAPVGGLSGVVPNRYLPAHLRA